MSTINKETFKKEFKESVEKIQKADVEVVKIISDLNPAESLLCLRDVTNVTFRAFISFMEDTESGVELISELFADMYIKLSKHFGKDFVSSLNLYYVKSKDPEMFKEISKMFKDDNDNDDNSDNGGSVC